MLAYKKTSLQFIFQIDGTTIKVQFWDTAGGERFRSITSAYYRGAVGALVVYDITKYSTFANVDFWINELKQKGNKDMIILLVGNKIDLSTQQTVSTQEAAFLASSRSISFIETSALDTTNVKEAFDNITKEIHERYPSKALVTPISLCAAALYNENNRKRVSEHIKSVNGGVPDIIDKKPLVEKKGCCNL